MKENILERLAQTARERVCIDKQNISFDQMKQKAENLATDNSFLLEKRLRAPGISFICEIKKASPSKGVIAEIFP